MLKILPPEKAKEKAQERVKEWERQREIEEEGQKLLNEKLVKAVEERDPDRVKDLLDKGADPNARDGVGRAVFRLTVSEYCLQRSYSVMEESAPESISRIPLQILKSLADHGAEIDVMVRRTLTTMMYNDDYGRDVIAEILKKDKVE